MGQTLKVVWARFSTFS